MRNQVDSSTLVDIRTIQVDSTLTKSGRIAEFVRQIKNPFRFICNGYEVTARFNDDGPTFEECLQSIMS